MFFFLCNWAKSHLSQTREMSQEYQESLSQALWKYRIYFNVVTSPSSHLRTSCLLHPKVTNFFNPPKCQTKTSHHTKEITSRLHNRKWHSCWHTNLWCSVVLRIKSDICKTWHPFVNTFSAILPRCVLCDKIISSEKKGPSLFFSFYFYYYYYFFKTFRCMRSGFRCTALAQLSSLSQVDVSFGEVRVQWGPLMI